MSRYDEYMDNARRCNVCLDVETETGIVIQAENDHSKLFNRDAAGQHSIGAITGLQEALDSKLDGHIYASLERLGEYAFRVTYNEVPEYVPSNVRNLGGCSSYVRNGRLYRNFDWNYDEAATYAVVTKDFVGIAKATDPTNFELGQLPYRVVDGVNSSGIMVSAHIVFNDFNWHSRGDVQQTYIPYAILAEVHSIDELEEKIRPYLNHLDKYDGESVLMFMVSDGVRTRVVSPASDDYEILDATDNPKLTNFKWTPCSHVVKSELQKRPVGIERFNMMPCNLKDLRYTKCYESPSRLSEFIGINGTTKDSTDEELMAIYNYAHNLYENRSRDGELWHTMHSVVYSPHGMERLCVQEYFDGSVLGNITDHTMLDNRDYPDQHPIVAITGLQEALDAKQDELVAGTGIDITDNVISNTGVTNMAVNASGTLIIWKGLQLA